MRITTNMVMRNYQNHLERTIGGLESSRKQVSSGRRFAWSYEDPSAAAKGAILDRRYARNADYLDATKESQKWLDTQEDVLNQINRIVQKIDEYDSTSAMDDPKGQVGRTAYAAELREYQNSMINSLNVKYGDAFVMAGNDGKNAPFKIEDGKVYYRNINVDCQKPVAAKYSVEVGSENFKNGDTITMAGSTIANPPGSLTVNVVADDDATANGTTIITESEANNPQKLTEILVKNMEDNKDPNSEYTIAAEGNKIVYTAKKEGAIGSDGPVAEPTLTLSTTSTDGTVSAGALQTVRQGYDADQDYETLQKYAKEAAYVDLGFGLVFDDVTGEVVSSSAFDTALPGIKAMGYGKDDDGLSNNLIVLTGQLAELLEADEFDREAYGEIWTKLHNQYQKFANEFTTLGAKSQQLEATLTRLTNEKDNIYEQYKDTVGIQEEEAITNYSWAQYAYNVALKIGTSIISPSLLDFMN